ncbi:uncharacterized protein NEMAJ01_0935 [Nematocida major]|uniref:uncharacterized protein n=1 Tax=Nematocida major TaxID=1912982 RepID=UPI0020078EBE|nr:uncharacterized protein NEMAJ01_0935 [Nematocida major]KAH9386039.1 hypothetical protein NEMAJ01_0935 [Nematocida major]
MFAIPVGVGSNGGNSFELAKLLKRDLERAFSLGHSALGQMHAEVCRGAPPGESLEGRERGNRETPDESGGADRKRLRVDISDMDSIAADSLADLGMAVFICSTTGDGDAPYNMQQFWKALKRKSLNGKFDFYFAVIGLGDSNYTKYNYAGKRLFNRLQQVGGTPLCRRCDCDEMDPMGVYTAYTPWVEELKGKVQEKWAALSKNRLSCLEAKEKPHRGTYLGKKQLAPAPREELEKINSVLGECENTCTEAGGSLSGLGSIYSAVYEYSIELDIPGYEYSIGDVLSIEPENADYKAVSSEIFFDDEELASKKIDYSSIPMHHHIKDLYCMAKEGKHVVSTCPEGQREMYLARLGEISQSYDMYHQYILQMKKPFKDVLRDFYLKISVKSGLIRRIYPRYYTISKRDGQVYSITAGRIEMKHYKQRIKGVCSEYLFHLGENSCVSVDIKKTQLEIEGDVLVVCTGTGMALGRAIVNEYAQGRAQGISSVSVLFGFRSLFIDCLHFAEMVEKGPVRVLHKGRHFYVCAESEEKGVKMLLGPSRASLCKGLLAKHAVNPGDVEEKNYIENILDIIDTEDLDRNIILCGSVRLLKTVPGILERRTGGAKKPHSECW